MMVKRPSPGLAQVKQRFGSSEGLCLKGMRDAGGWAWERQVGTLAKGRACFESWRMLGWWHDGQDFCVQKFPRYILEIGRVGLEERVSPGMGDRG